jgi:hypothetical protein
MASLVRFGVWVLRFSSVGTLPPLALEAALGAGRALAHEQQQVCRYGWFSYGEVFGCYGLAALGRGRGWRSVTYTHTPHTLHAPLQTGD